MGCEIIFSLIILIGKKKFLHNNNDLPNNTKPFYYNRRMWHGNHDFEKNVQR